MTLMALVVTYNTIRRYVFKEQDQYAFVVTCFLTIFCICFSLAGVQRQRMHLRVDLLDKFLPKIVVGIITNIVNNVLGLTIVGLIVWKSWEYAWFSFLTGDIVTGATVKVVSWPARMIVPLCFGLLGLVLLVQLVRYIVLLVKNSGKAITKIPEAASSPQT